jgi:hypothetical protein
MMEELRLEFDREVDRRKLIENKASNLITLCSSIIAFLFAFTALSQKFFQTPVANPYPTIPPILIVSLIIPSVILIVLSLLSSLLAIMVGKNLPTAFLLDSLVYRDNTIIQPAIEGFRRGTLERLTIRFQLLYTSALVLHDEVNEKKFIRTLFAQKLLFVGIALLSAALILTYVNFIK